MILRRRSPHRATRSARPWPLVVVGGVLAAAASLTTALFRGGNSASDVAVTVAIAAAVGLVIGLIGAWIVARFGALIRTRRDLEQVTSAPNLAVIPRHPLGAERPEDVVMFRDPNSIDAEAYRTLRTAFEFVAAKADAAPQRGVVVLVTSPRPGEGKSSVAANLAAATAMAGRRVALVDGDLRKPQIHRLFRLANTAGLSSLLAGETSLVDAVQRLDGMRELVVLSAGPPPSDPAEVLTDARLAAVLSRLAAASHLVVVDAPPLLAVTDPAIIAQHCDVVLMVATADLSSKREWVEALARLAVVDATVVGTVLLEPDDRIRAVPIYRYAPSAVPQNWWVTPGTAASTSTTDDTVGLRVVGATGAGSDDAGAPADTETDVNDEWSQHPFGR
jgi:capsular exopolysaccharide synthesis family protein